MAVKVAVVVVILMGSLPPVKGGPEPYRFLLARYDHIRFHYLAKPWVVVAAAAALEVVFLQDKDDDSKGPPSIG